MRKRFVLYVIICIAFIGVAVYLSFGISRGDAAVQIKEKEHTGNSELVKGVTAELIISKYDNNVVWNVKTSLGEKPKTETKMTDNGPLESYTEKYENKGFCLGYDAEWEVLCEMVDQSEKCSIPEFNENYKGFAQIYTEENKDSLAKEGIELNKLINYYPFLTCICITGKDAEGNNYYLNAETHKESIEDADSHIRDFFIENFRIPVQQDERMELLPLGGDKYTFGHNPDSDEYTMSHYDVQLSDDWFFTFDTHTKKDKVVNTDELTYGYGIYRVPFSKTKQHNKAPFDIEKLENFYPLDPEIKVLGLSVDKQEKNLFLLYYLNWKSYCSVIDIESGKEQQNILLDDKEFLEFDNMSVYDDFLIITFVEKTDRWNQKANPENSDGKVLILKKNQDGKYEVSFVCDRYNMEGDGVFYPMDADFDGENLITIEGKEKDFQDYTEIVDCNFEVCIYDKTGLLYCGKYENSLNVNFENKGYAPYISDIRIKW